MYCSLHHIGGKEKSEKEKHLDQDPQHLAWGQDRECQGSPDTSHCMDWCGRGSQPSEHGTDTGQHDKQNSNKGILGPKEELGITFT